MSWVGEDVAGDRAGVKKEGSGSSESEWSGLEWSDSEEGDMVKEEEWAEVKVKKEEEEEEVYTQTNRLKSSGVTATTKTTKIKKEEDTAADTPLSHISSRTTQKPAPTYTLEPTRPGPIARPGPSTPRRAHQTWVDDSEIMRHLVGGMAGLAIPMSQDEGGRWRIQQRP